MAFGGSDSNKQKQTQTAQPWAPLQAPLKQAIGDATKLYNSGAISAANAYYPGQTVAPLSPETQQAWSGIATRAANGSPLNAASSQYVQDVLSGKYLNAGNPYQAELDQSISDAVLPSVTSQWSAGGRYGSAGMGQNLTKSLADAIAPQHYANYQQERGNQQAAASLAPQLANNDYTDLLQLLQVGQGRQDFAQTQINADQDRWAANQQQPLKTLQQYFDLLNGNYGGTTTTTSSGPTGGSSYSPWGTALNTGASLLGSYLAG